MASAMENLRSVYELEKQLDYWEKRLGDKDILDIRYADGIVSVTRCGQDGSSDRAELPPIENGDARPLCYVKTSVEPVNGKYRQMLCQTFGFWNPDIRGYHELSDADRGGGAYSGAYSRYAEKRAFRLYSTVAAEEGIHSPYPDPGAYTNEVAYKISENTTVLDLSGSFAEASATGVSAEASVAEVGLSGISVDMALVQNCFDAVYVMRALGIAYAYGAKTELSALDNSLWMNALWLVPLSSFIYALKTAAAADRCRHHALSSRMKSLDAD